MTDEVLQIERHGAVALIRLNRPASRNAVNVELAAALVAAIATCQDSRCIVITGSLPPFIKAVADSGVPTIAAVNGAAVTGGFEIALACDFIVASDRARFADTHLRVGVYPGPVLVDLPRRVGMAKAREMSMTGNFVDAETALRIGLANHVVAHDDLLPVALKLAADIAEQDPVMVATMRRDWDETGTMARRDAYRRHYEIATVAGFAGVGTQTLRDNMAAVVDRAKQQ
jgi:enoyl-CoA hydratase